MATKKAAKKTTRSERTASESKDEAPNYRVLEESYIDNGIRKAGSTVTYFGLPGRALEPLNAEAKSRKTQVRDIMRDKELDADEKQAALKELSDEWNGVDDVPAWYENEGDESDSTDIRTPNARNTKPLPDAERIELESHATASRDAEELKQREDTNFTKIKLTGSPDMIETDQSKQAATPVTDGRESSKK